MQNIPFRRLLKNAHKAGQRAVSRWKNEAPSEALYSKRDAYQNAVNTHLGGTGFSYNGPCEIAPIMRGGFRNRGSAFYRIARRAASEHTTVNLFALYRQDIQNNGLHEVSFDNAAA